MPVARRIVEVEVKKFVPAVYHKHEGTEGMICKDCTLFGQGGCRIAVSAFSNQAETCAKAIFV